MAEPYAAAAGRRVFLAGTFDVANYGDLLFPLVAAARLAEAGIAVIPVSPTATKPAYADAMQPVAATQMLADPAFEVCGILVGGGYILISQAATGLPSYEAAGIAGLAYPSLWIGAALAAALRDVPLLFNAPGAPFPFSSRRLQEAILPALRAADYLSFRDAASASLFPAPDLAPRILPDSVLELPRVWPRAALLQEHQALLRRHGIPPERRCLALHVRARAMGDVEALAARLSDFAEAHDLLPVLLVLGPELGDRETAAALAPRMRTATLLLNEAGSLKTLAAAIAGAHLYVGGSLHGYITAAAYGVPGVMLALPAHGKFRGLLKQLGRPADMARDWDGALQRGSSHLASPAPAALPAAVPAALDAHWRQIVAGLGDRAAGSGRRAIYLRHHLATNCGLLGTSWLLGPQLSGSRGSIKV
ncbi:hypothetical protein BKE38_11095 [Pseudoroseomonas deserti]|uniref:Polysaccharide pyruvyl transferase domain-containing protein n=1 Tax=Teichococcus deserti TaxID=1817963 RepID=A0A1V2H3Z7_9PROT|nr:polysaccharide pyruvyl transferase family protein [Pseudoroseomonas deserti]ONG54014.1 hypothetical protein BKE38_11095 [Pseudoroseomonas deserti]